MSSISNALQTEIGSRNETTNPTVPSLEHYAPVYAKVAVDQLKIVVKRVMSDATVSVSQDNRSLKILNADHMKIEHLKESVNVQNLFCIAAEVIDQELAIVIRNRLPRERSGINSNDMLVMAEQTPDPIGFLQDHWKYLEYSPKKIFKFLNERNGFDDPRTIDFLTKGALKGFGLEKTKGEDSYNLFTLDYVRFFVKTFLHSHNKEIIKSLDRILTMFLTCTYDTNGNLLGITKIFVEHINNPDFDPFINRLAKHAVERKYNSMTLIIEDARGKFDKYKPFYTDLLENAVRTACTNIYEPEKFEDQNREITRIGFEMQVFVPSSELRRYIKIAYQKLPPKLGFLRTTREILDEKDGKWGIRFTFDNVNIGFCGNAPLIELAELHGEPVVFLLDHRLYWGIEANEVLNFLGTKERIALPGVMEIFEEGCETYKTDYERLNGLTQALSHQHLQERALVQLNKIASSSSDICVRKHACMILGVVKSSVTGSEFLTSQVTQNTDFSVRFFCRSIIDRRFQYQTVLDKVLLTQMLRSIDLETVDTKNARACEFICWKHPEAAYEALCSYGESKIVTTLLERLRMKKPTSFLIECKGLNPLGGFSADISPTVPFYSLLKLIAIHTRSQEISHKILFELKEIVGYGRLGLVQDFDKLLWDVSRSGRHPLPDSLVDSAFQKHSYTREKPNSVYEGGLNRDDEWTQYAIRREKGLMLIITGVEYSIDIRLLALREAIPELFPKVGYPLCRSFKDLWKIVEELTKDESSQILREEAQLIVSLRDQPKEEPK